MDILFDLINTLLDALQGLIGGAPAPGVPLPDLPAPGVPGVPVPGVPGVPHP